MFVLAEMAVNLRYDTRRSLAEEIQRGDFVH